MACSKEMFKFLLLLLPLFISTTSWGLNSTALDVAAIRSVCKSTPYPDVCFDSVKLSISVNINIFTYFLQSLHVAVSEAGKLSVLLSSNDIHSSIVEKQRGAIQDCKELHQITVSSLKRSLSTISSSQKLADAKAFLSAALTNKNTCLEGLESASGPLKPVLVDSITTTYKHVSNSLSLLSAQETHYYSDTTNPMALPRWLSRKDHRMIFHKFHRFATRSDDEEDDDDNDDNDYQNTLIVALDGTGNFTTITDAINSAANNSLDRIIIYVRQGLYQENVVIPSNKPNILLVGEGSDVTIITGNRSVVDGWTTFRSATVGVSGEGFLARDICFENTAGPEKHQAVALRINADFAAVYRCTINGYQDTLYAHSFRQFYRECDIYGTIDYIFGNSAVVFQGCNIISKMPMPGQFTVVAAQSRESPDQQTGISFQNCSVLAAEDLYSHSSNSSTTIKSYLGRPWKEYSRTVFIETYIDDFIDPAGWTPWSVGDQGLDTLYYGEYANTGPGSVLDNRVAWPGYHIMDYKDAANFSVAAFIVGREWLDSTSFPYDDGI